MRTLNKIIKSRRSAYLLEDSRFKNSGSVDRFIQTHASDLNDPMRVTLKLLMDQQQWNDRYVCTREAFSVKRIARIRGKSEVTIKRHLRELECLEYIEKLNCSRSDGSTAANFFAFPKFLKFIKLKLSQISKSFHKKTRVKTRVANDPPYTKGSLLKSKENIYSSFDVFLNCKNVFNHPELLSAIRKQSKYDSFCPQAVFNSIQVWITKHGGADFKNKTGKSIKQFIFSIINGWHKMTWDGEPDVKTEKPKPKIKPKTPDAPINDGSNVQKLKALLHQNDPFKYQRWLTSGEILISGSNIIINVASKFIGDFLLQHEEWTIQKAAAHTLNLQPKDVNIEFRVV